MKKIEKNKMLKIFIIVLLIALPFIIEFLNFNVIDFSKNMIIRLGIVYGIYLLIFLYKIINKYFYNKIELIVNKIIKYRYYIAILMFIILVICKINFSSLDIWLQLLNEDSQYSSTIIGHPRGIRSDEWLVYTPLMLAQAQNDDWYAQYNENVAQGSYNMMINGLPVANLTIIAHPMQWGFLLFGQEYGYSWYWAMKMILLILVSIELALIVTKKDSILSLAGGIFLALSPCMVWWLSTAVVDAYIYGILIVILFRYYIENIDKYKIRFKLLIALGMIITIPAFAMTLYPAYQIPLAYLIIGFLLLDYINNIKKIKKVDYLIMGVTLLISILILAYFVVVSWNDILIEINTVYPGARFETGGNFVVGDMVKYLMNIFLGIDSEVPHSNTCEVSTYIYPFLATIVLLIYTIINKEFKFKENKLLIIITIIYLALFVWLYIGFPTILSKITLLYTSPCNRTNLVFGLLGVLITLILIKKYENKQIFTTNKSIIMATVVTIFTYILLKNSEFYSYFSIIKLELVIIIEFALTYFLFTANKKAFSVLIVLIAMISGAIVNPITRGTKVFYETEVYSQISKIEEENPRELWIGNSNISGQYLMAAGINVLNGVNLYPNFEWLDIVDPEKKFEEVYNRYAHIGILLGEETNFKLNYPDNYTATLTYKNIKDLGIKYIFSLEKYNEEIVEQFKLKTIYSNTNKNQYIYEFE